MRKRVLVAVASAYAISLTVPTLIYPYLSTISLSDMVLGPLLMLAVGAPVGLVTALITRSTAWSALTSVIGGELGLLTPHVLSDVVGVAPSILLHPLDLVPVLQLFILLSPFFAALVSFVYVVGTSLKAAAPEKEKTVIPERVEEVGPEAPQRQVEEVTVEREVGAAESVEREAEPEARVEEVKAGAEPELEFLKELVEAEEKAERVELERAPVEELQLKKCIHCGETIPGDSIYCPVCGKYLGEEKSA